MLFFFFINNPFNYFLVQPLIGIVINPDIRAFTLNR